MPTARKLGRWLWPTAPRPAGQLSVRAMADRFVYVLCLGLVLGAFLYTCWYKSTRADHPRDERGNVVIQVDWCATTPDLCEDPE